MPTTFTQTDTATDCGPQTACTTGTVATTTGETMLVEGGTPGTTETVLAPPAGVAELSYFMQTSGGVYTTTWESGTYTVNINVTTAGSNVELSHIYLCRLDSTCGSLATVGDAAFANPLDTTGTYSFNITGTQQTANDSDDLYVILEFTGTHNQQAGEIGITRSETVATPINRTIEISETASLATTVSFSTDEASVKYLSGTCTMDGSAVSGAVIYVVNTTADAVYAETTSDSNGNWTVTVPTGNTYHVAAQYDDGSTKYNEHSNPFLVT